MEERFSGLWVELVFGWPEKVGLLRSIFRSFLRTELEAYCVGRGAGCLPLSNLDGEDIVFLLQILFGSVRCSRYYAVFPWRPSPTRSSMRISYMCTRTRIRMRPQRYAQCVRARKYRIETLER